MSIKAAWRDASLGLWGFSRTNKHCIHLSTKTIYLSHLVCEVSVFATIEISYSTAVCNKSAAGAWIFLVSFYVGEWSSERFHCRMYLPQNNHFLHNDIHKENRVLLNSVQKLKQKLGCIRPFFYVYTVICISIHFIVTY